MSAKLIKELNYYIEHQEEFVNNYLGKYIVLKGKNLLGVYDNPVTAIEETSKQHEPGTFFVHLVEPGKENYTATIYNPLLTE